MTSTPSYGFRLNKDSEGPMQTAIKAGDTNQIQQLLAKRFPGISFQAIGEDEEVDKPQETVSTTVAGRGGVIRRTAGGSTSPMIGDIYEDYVTNLSPTARNIITTDYKGTRGGRLGAGGYTTESIVPGAQVAQPALPAAPKQFAGFVGTAGIEEIGEKGFGLKDYTAAIEAGYSPESIKSWVESQRDNLFNIGPGAQEALGIKGYVSTTPGVFDYTQFGEAGFGLKDVEALRAQGVADTTLKKLAANAPMVGPGAAAQLGYAPTQQQRTESIARSYDPASAGEIGFGLKDVEALKSQGVSEAQMRDIARRSPQIGEGARKLLGL